MVNQINYRGEQFFKGHLETRCKLKVFQNVYDRVKNNNNFLLYALKTSCFGDWLSINDKQLDGDPLLVHVMLQTQVVPYNPEDQHLHFRIGTTNLYFGPREFSLMTHLKVAPLGCVNLGSSKDFLDRLFDGKENVKVEDVKILIQSSRFFDYDDEDALRLCLLYILTSGFMGISDQSPIDEFLLSLVQDIDEWNRYPWGKYIWDKTYISLRDALLSRGSKIEHKKSFSGYNDAPRYSLAGFVFAFKVWILETFPIASNHYRREPNGLTPRCLWWTRRKTRYSWTDFCSIIDVTQGNYPNLELKPTVAEWGTPWWQTTAIYYHPIERVSPCLPSHPQSSFHHVPSRKNSIKHAKSKDVDEGRDDEIDLLIKSQKKMLKMMEEMQQQIQQPYIEPQWYPQEPFMQPQWYPQGPSMQPQWYPRGPPMQPQWYPEGPPMQPQWYPEGPPMQPQWYPEGPPMQPQWYPQGPSMQPQWYPEGPSTQPQWYPEGPPMQSQWYPGGSSMQPQWYPRGPSMRNQRPEM